MQIKRNYNEPFFREHLLRKRKRQMVWRRTLIFLLLIVISGALVITTQPGLVMQATYKVLGIEATATPLPSTLATQAQEYFYQGRLQQAADLLAEAAEMRPDNIDYLYEYGMILLDMDESEAAMAVADQISDVDSNDVRGYALRARSMVWLGQSAAAIPVARAGLQINPNFAPLYEVLSWAYTNTSDWQQGVDYGQLAVEADPGNVRAYWAYSNAMATVGETNEAMRLLNEAIAVHPYYLAPYFQLASLYLAVSRDQEAIDLYNRIIGLQPRNARAMLRLCQAYLKVGEFQRALGMCQDAVDNDPTDVRSQFQLAMLLYDDLDFRGALDAFEVCNDLDPTLLGCHYRMALSYYYVARDAVQVCQTNPSDPICETVYPTQGCQMAWDTLEDSLIMAQAQNSDQADIDNIRAGLDAIIRDPYCPGVSGNMPFVSTPTPELDVTPDAASSG
ncbi:MAG: hypothetical protein CL607_01670 [Anaerolineaceae bacterium]|nr:hypothetical protein [Anaerolineaceae bacterium]